MGDVTMHYVTRSDIMKKQNTNKKTGANHCEIEIPTNADVLTNTKGK
jgi:hypothetical protein